MWSRESLGAECDIPIEKRLDCKVQLKGPRWGGATLDPGQKRQQVLRSRLRRKVSRTLEAGEVFFMSKKNRYSCLRVSDGGAVLWELSDVVIPRKSW